MPVVEIKSRLVVTSTLWYTCSYRKETYSFPIRRSVSRGNGTFVPLLLCSRTHNIEGLNLLFSKVLGIGIATSQPWVDKGNTWVHCDVISAGVSYHIKVKNAFADPFKKGDYIVFSGKVYKGKTAGTSFVQVCEYDFFESVSGNELTKEQVSLALKNIITRQNDQDRILFNQ